MTKIIRVDEVDDVVEDIEKFKWIYDNADGEEESVNYRQYGNSISIVDSFDKASMIYIEDIPNLIKALQAAHKHITNS